MTLVSKGNDPSPTAHAAWLGLAAALSLSLVGFFLSTRHGMGLGNDSRAFIGPALAHLRGDASINLHHPPLFPWLIWAVAALTGSDVMEAVRSIQLFATVAIIVGVWWPLRWALPDRPCVAGAAAVLTATAFPILEFSGNVGSDQLGAAFAVWTLGLLARHLATAGADWRWLGGCVVVAALAFLNRFAAFGLVLSVSTVLWLHRGKPFGRDFLWGLGAGLVMVTPGVLNLLGNITATGHATTREIVWTGIPWDRIGESLSTLSLWFLPNALARWPVGLGLLIAGAAWFWVGRGWSSAAPIARSLVITLVGFVVTNLLFLVVTIALVEYGLALDSRTLLPCQPVSFMLVALVIGVISTTALQRATALLGFLFFFALNTHRAAGHVASYYVLGRHHLGIMAAQSALPDFVRAHPEATFISNNPPYFFNLTRTGCVELPAELSLLTNRRDPGIESKITALRARLRDRAPSFLVVFDTTDIESRVSAQRVMDGDHFNRVMNGYFFVIYRFSPPSATGTP